MTSLIAATALFVALHRLIAGTRLRDILIDRLGPPAYLIGMSTAVIGSLVWMGFAYAAARARGPAVYWTANDAMRWVQVGLTLIAFLLIVPGRMQINPTGVLQYDALDRPDVVRGMLRISRHPYLWGVAIWAAGHMLVNGDAASLVLFGGLFIVAVSGTYSIDAKRSRRFGARWAAFARQTSNLPFAAILDGRQSLKLAEIGWWKPALAIAAWGALIAAHPYLFGRTALPGF